MGVHGLLIEVRHLVSFGPIVGVVQVRLYSLLLKVIVRALKSLGEVVLVTSEVILPLIFSLQLFYLFTIHVLSVKLLFVYQSHRLQVLFCFEDFVPVHARQVLFWYSVLSVWMMPYDRLETA